MFGKGTTLFFGRMSHGRAEQGVPASVKETCVRRCRESKCETQPDHLSVSTYLTNPEVSRLALRSHSGNGQAVRMLFLFVARRVFGSMVFKFTSKSSPFGRHAPNLRSHGTDPRNEAGSSSCFVIHCAKAMCSCRCCHGKFRWFS